MLVSAVFNAGFQDRLRIDLGVDVRVRSDMYSRAYSSELAEGKLNRDYAALKYSLEPCSIASSSE